MQNLVKKKDYEIKSFDNRNNYNNNKINFTAGIVKPIEEYVITKKEEGRDVNYTFGQGNDSFEEPQ